MRCLSLRLVPPFPCRDGRGECGEELAVLSGRGRDEDGGDEFFRRSVLQDLAVHDVERALQDCAIDALAINA